jgi:hypothetical protein
MVRSAGHVNTPGPDWLECHGFVLDKGLAIGVI